MGELMGRSHPMELRTRVVAYVDEGHGHREAARHFRVSLKFVNDLVKLRRETGFLTPRQQGNGGGHGKLSGVTNWLKARVAAGLPAQAQPVVWSFGDHPALADELLGLVLDGTKTATASLLWYYEEGGETIPAVGDLSIITDGNGTPRALIRTTDWRVPAEGATPFLDAAPLEPLA